MGDVVLCKGITFGEPRRTYRQSTGRVDEDIYKKSNSLAVYPPTQAAFYEGDNYSGVGLVITAGGSLKDLSNTPWGNWSNRIASVKISEGGADFVGQMKREHTDTKLQIVNTPLPDPLDDVRPQSTAELSLDLITSFTPDVVDHVMAVLRAANDEEGIRKFERFLSDRCHPLSAAGISPRLDLEASGRPLASPIMMGGGGNITQTGMNGRVQLDANTVGSTATFSIAGQAIVQFDMFMPFATVPCGAWTYGGPGSWQQYLGGNILGCAPALGSICYLSAFHKGGDLPVYVTAN